jgi:hypothetical protein
VSTSEAITRHDALARVAVELEHIVDELVATAACSGPEADEESLRRIVSAAARLHARYSDPASGVDPLREDISPTEAVDLACGLLRARDLNPFDLALWFSRAA